MFVRNLHLTNFRNYHNLELSLPACLVIVQGNNAQGKTNLLEAILVISTTRSHRASSDRDLVYHDPSLENQIFARLIAEVQKKRDDIKIEVALRGDGPVDPAAVAAGQARKRLRINGIARRAIDVIGQVNTVIFSAQDINLTCGTPSLCRRYLDQISSQTDAQYFRSLQQYQKVLLQRNHLLKLIAEHKAKPDQLEYWNCELVASGSYIIRYREHLVGMLNELADRIHQELSGGRESLKIAYRPNVGKEESNTETIESQFYETLHRVRSKEISQGITSTGPHRDSLLFEVNKADVGRYGSRGQQRTTALSLKLAEAEFLHTQAGDTPILLLDDVLSELDQARCQHLLEFILPYQQVMVTTTDVDRFSPQLLGQACQLKVRQGTIEVI